jgi:hypothetical protein
LTVTKIGKNEMSQTKKTRYHLSYELIREIIKISDETTGLSGRQHAR